MTRRTYYITTPIYYPSDRLHIGHAYTTVAADAIARFKKLQGYDVLFLTGTDEHGQNIEQRAMQAQKTPREFVDGIVDGIKELWRLMDIQYDDFIRTTEDRHFRVVQEIFRRVYESGDIYKGEYEGWYCTGCEAYFTDTQARDMDGRCPDHDRPLERLREHAYFFRLSKYADGLLKHIDDNPGFIQPESRRNEVVSFVRSGLEDLCVSRTSFRWGIPVPFDPGHVIYVWFDALSNYLTGCGYLQDHNRYGKYWPADLHLIGKEIVRFHAVIWPIILMAAGLELPKQVFGHGWLVLESGKMSKTRGNVVDPVVLVGKYGLDAVRYFLLREVPFGADGVYSEDAMVARINADLANDLGNLVHRTLAMIKRFLGGVIREPAELEEIDVLFKEKILATPAFVEKAFDALELSNGLAAVGRLVSAANKYIDDTAPWSLFRSGDDSRLGTVFYNLCEALRVVAVLLTPFLVETPERIWQYLGLPGQPRTQDWESLNVWGLTRPGSLVQEAAPLFPRIEAVPDRDASIPPAGAAAPATVDLEEFKRLDLKVGTIIKAEAIKGASRLLKLVVDTGDEHRQVVAGIAEHYEPEQLAGKQVVLVANLKPVTIRGVESRGMILAASDGKGLRLLMPDGPIEEGSPVS
ncbi:MAG: methionine--tRNA ligase [Bacillota bacterium]